MDGDGIVRGLNEAQRDAVTSQASVLQVLAPPGSGKTKTLTSRVAYHIAVQQLKPWNIITCTFTRKAANEMKERIRTFIGEDLTKQIKLGTFHSIAVLYLRQYGQHIALPRDFGIADSSDSKAIIKRIVRRHDFGLEPGPTLARISARKCKEVESGQVEWKIKQTVEQLEFTQVFVEYEAELKASNLLDYDDLLLRCCLLLRQHPQCVSNVQAVLIDEFQDTNNIQYDLMTLFAQASNTITIVGDPDQSIYGFRNAEIKNLVRMKQNWPDTLTINLKDNYRSSGAILRAAQNIIEQDVARPPKKLQATHTHGLTPVLRRLPTAAAEASWMISEIKRICALTGNMLEPSDVAILLRSAPLSRAIETALGNEGVPYRMIGGIRFYERAEVRLVLDYLRVINQPNNNATVDRIINNPPRRIGDVTVKSLLEEARHRGSSFWTFARDIVQGRVTPTTKLSAPARKGLEQFVHVIISGQKKLLASTEAQTPLVDLINLIMKKVDLVAHLKNKYEADVEARWSNVEELIAQAADASDPEHLKAQIERDKLPTIEGLEQRPMSAEDVLSTFLANVALTTTAEEKATEDGRVASQVTISTIHSAKGLEWPVVFIPACYEGSIPHSRAEDSDEERRLLYVGMTRAQAILYLSCPVKNTQREEATMSSFLTQPGVDRYFEQFGPSISPTSITVLAQTLRRTAPTTEAVKDAKQGLEGDEDNYWPLNGEQPVETLRERDDDRSVGTLSTFGTMRPGFSADSLSTTMQQHQQGFRTASAAVNAGLLSVKPNCEEIAEQGKLRNIDKRAAETHKMSKINAPVGRKRQIDGQGTISQFFTKRVRETSEPQHQHADAKRFPHHATALRPISDNVRSSAPEILSSQLMKEPYVRMSSWSTQPKSDANQAIRDALSGKADSSDKSAEAQWMPASTFHVTSQQSLHHRQYQPAQRGRRLGLRPSFNGWANRTRK